MRVPSKIRIKRDVAYEILFSDIEDWGQCRFQTKQIIINPKQSKTKLTKTIIHELIHAVDLENGKKHLTESQVRHLEEGFYRLLKLNGWLDDLFIDS